MAVTDRTKNKRKLANVKRLCETIDRHVVEIGQAYEEYQPEIAQACFQITEITKTLREFTDTILTAM